MSNQLWWGYLHINGSIQVKRYFDSQDMADAELSDFVMRVFWPFEAISRENAKQKIESFLKKGKQNER